MYEVKLVRYVLYVGWRLPIVGCDGKEWSDVAFKATRHLMTSRLQS